MLSEAVETERMRGEEGEGKGRMGQQREEEEEEEEEEGGHVGEERVRAWRLMELRRGGRFAKKRPTTAKEKGREFE